MLKISQYPRNFDGTAMDLEVGVLTDSAGNNGARLTEAPVGPDGAPIDAKGLVLVDKDGNPVVISAIPGSTMAIALFSSANTVAIPTGTNVVQTGGYSVGGTGGALYVFDAAVDAAYVAANPRISFRSLNNRGFRLAEYQPLEMRMFGAVADNATDDYPAFVAAFGFLQTYTAVTAFVNPTFYRGAANLKVTRGKYYCSQTLEPLATFRMTGEGGLGWGAATQIRFPLGVTGLRLQAYNTSGVANLDGVNHFSGDAMVVEDIYFIGGFAGGVEGEFHGCHAKRASHIERCTFDNFEGDGFYGHVSFNSGVGATEGNVNTTRLTNCSFNNNRSGVSFQNADANAITLTACSFIGNRRWGREDRSFLGNPEFGSHYDANARNAWNSGAAGHPVSYVHDSGHYYFVIEGQEAGASVNRPSTTTADNTWWGYWIDGGASAATGIPTWFNGIAVRSGGPVLINGLNNASSVLGSHIENNGMSQLDQLGYTNVTTGYWECVSIGALFRNRARRLYAANAGLISAGSFCVSGNFSANASENFIGPQLTPLLDSLLYLDNTNAASEIVFRQSGVEKGRIGAYGAIGGLIIQSPIEQQYRIAGVTKLSIQGDGLHVIGVGVFSGALTASNLSGVNTGDQDLSTLQPIAPRVQSVASAATVTPTFSNDQVNITAQAAALNLANWTGATIPAFGLVIRIKDNGTARVITYNGGAGSKYRPMAQALPTTTVANKTMYLGFIYNSTDDKYDLVSVVQEA